MIVRCYGAACGQLGYCFTILICVLYWDSYSLGNMLLSVAVPNLSGSCCGDPLLQRTWDFFFVMFFLFSVSVFPEFDSRYTLRFIQKVIPRTFTSKIILRFCSVFLEEIWGLHCSV